MGELILPFHAALHLHRMKELPCEIVKDSTWLWGILCSWRSICGCMFLLISPAAFLSKESAPDQIFVSYTWIVWMYFLCLVLIVTHLPINHCRRLYHFRFVTNCLESTCTKQKNSSIWINYDLQNQYSIVKASFNGNPFVSLICSVAATWEACFFFSSLTLYCVSRFGPRLTKTMLKTGFIASRWTTGS